MSMTFRVILLKFILVNTRCSQAFFPNDKYTGWRVKDCPMHLSCRSWAVRGVMRLVRAGEKSTQHHRKKKKKKYESNGVGVKEIRSWCALAIRLIIKSDEKALAQQTQSKLLCKYT